MKRKRIRMLTMVLAAAFSMTLVLPMVGSAAQDTVDLDRRCSLTVHPVNDDSDYAEDLQKADVVADLYKVGDAVGNDGYDGYYYAVTGIYQELPTEYLQKITDPALIAEVTPQDWDALSAAAARLALLEAGESETGEAPDNGLVVTGARTGVPVSDLDPGLYLLVARGADLTNPESYITTVTDEEGTEHLVTVAYSEQNGYTFAPALVAVPAKDSFEGEVNTGNPGPWVYDLSVYLKPEQIPYGSLRIIKDLLEFESSEAATFVFQVEAELNGRNVYSDVAAFNFTQAGQQEVLIEKLPVGAVVTVTEIYSGSHYIQTGVTPGPVTITATDIATVEFSNTYDERRTGGHGIINRFSYDYINGVGGWNVIQDSVENLQNPNPPVNPEPTETPVSPENPETPENPAE